jgi:hypothetical protein
LTPILVYSLFLSWEIELAQHALMDFPRENWKENIARNLIDIVATFQSYLLNNRTKITELMYDSVCNALANMPQTHCGIQRM